MIAFIDHHTHNTATTSEYKKIISIKSISPTDVLPVTPFTIGLHPYDIDSFTDDDIQKIYEIARQDNCVGIGEAGLDYICNTDKEKQKRFFEKQIEISEFLQKPLVIHLVRATNDLLDIKKMLNPRQAWIVHGFRGKESLSKVLIDNGIYLSMGYYRNIQSLCNAYNNGRLLLETDVCDRCITEIYESVSKELCISTKELADNIVRTTPFINFLTSYGIDI